MTGRCPRELAVIGGGFVGLQTAVLAALSGVEHVIVVDINPAIVELINTAETPQSLHVKEGIIMENWLNVRDRIEATARYSDVAGVENYIVSVQTPLRGRRVDYTPLRKVGESLGAVVEKGDLVLSETTIYPGGTVELLGTPITRRTRLPIGSGGFLLAHSPERVNPGSRWTAEKIPRVAGGVDGESLDAAVALLRDCFGLNVYPVKDIQVAEASKLLENTFRLVNISLINELQRKFDAKGVDVREVVKAASTKPFGYMPFYPGPGAGGSCLPKDARMMEEHTGSLIVRIALEINDTQPLYTAAKILREARRSNASKILFYGLGYKPNVPYTIESPVFKVIEELSQLDPTLEIAKYDPLIVDESDFGSEEEALEWADMVIYWGKPPATIGQKKPVVDLSSL